MVDQKVIIHLSDDFSNEIGILTVISSNNHNNLNSHSKISNNIELENVPLVDKPDNLTPIQYWENNEHNFANLMFLEETEYQVLFESYEVGPTYDVLYSLTKINDSHFKPLRFSLGDNKKYRVAGTLNFKSYVGKSFLDVRKNNINSKKIPIEVRSKKIDYFSQYSSMIADLSQHALSLIFEVNSPLYQEFDLDNGPKKILYEDFMLLEYLFRPENLPSIFEYLSKNLHSQLKEHIETIPLSFASNLNQNTLKNIVSKPSNLCYSEGDFEIVRQLNGCIPRQIDQIKHEDVIDVPENRFFKYFLELIQDLIRELIEKLPNDSKEGYINDKLLSFEDEISYFLSTKFFNHISAMNYVPFNSQILQKKEGYREIFHYFLMFEFSFRLSWDEVSSQFKGFEKKLSELYEYWCYFKLLKVLNDLSEIKINFEDIFKINENNWSISIKKGQSSVKKFKIFIDGTEFNVELFYNLKFSKKSPKYISYSLIFKPDYTLKISFNDNVHYIHFDAKYRSEFEILGRESDKSIDERDYLEENKSIFKNGDIYKMHTYKDSILKSHGAYVLYPGNSPENFHVFESQAIPSVGAFSLTPGKEGHDEKELSDFICEVLKILCGVGKYYIYEWRSDSY